MTLPELAPLLHRPAEALTLEAVKNCIGFKPGTGLHTSLSGMCDYWFYVEKAKGSTDEEAAKIALDGLSRAILGIDARMQQAVTQS